LGASGALDDLSGGVMSGVNWYAPSLLRAQETDLAHMPQAEVVRLLKTGRSSQAWVSGPMGEVVQNSTQYLRDDDLRAIATYVQSLAQQALNDGSSIAAAVPSRKASARSVDNGAAIYKDHCAQCHGEQGQGKGDAYPALAGNRAVQMSHITNLVQALTYGGFSPATQAQPQPYGMPPFVLTLSDRDMADVLTHIRQQWGNQAPTVTEFDVTRVRVLQTH
jgi:mono/diheme cytochrome c family protein